MIHKGARYLHRWLRTNLRFGGMAVRCFGSHQARRKFEELGYSMGVEDVKHRLPTKNLSNLVDAETKICLSRLFSHHFNTSSLELATICSLLASESPTVVFEIGTFDGRTTVNMSQNLPADAKIYTLDLPPEAQNLPDGKRAGELIDDEVHTNVTRLYGNSQTMDFSPYLGQVDFIFIDAAHDYASVVHDTKVALQMLRQDAPSTIIWHDYIRFAGVTRAVDELIGKVGRPQEFCHIANTSLAYMRTSGAARS